MTWLRPPLHTDGTWIRDALGRVVLLRGVNLSGRHKQPPFISVSRPEELDPLCAAGVGVIRLVMVWEAIEPEPGRYDESYLEHLSQLARWAATREIAVIADMHQDIYARAFGGSGAPRWTIDPAYLAEGPEGEPDPHWFMRYGSSEGVRSSLARFFTDPELQQHFFRAWELVAERLAGEPWVVGFEPYNEPFPGALEVERFEEEQLQPFYQQVVARVRAVAPHWLAFLEGVLLGSESGTRLRLSSFERAVYFPHFYDKLTQVSRRYDGISSEMDKVLAVYAKDAAMAGVPWMLGEYGIPQDAPGGAAYLEDHQQALDHHLAGGTAWHWNPGAEDWNRENMSLVGPGGAETPLWRALLRPYPLLIAGTPERFHFDARKRECVLEYQADGSEAATVLFLPARIFGNLPRIQASVGRAQHQALMQRVTLRAPGHQGAVRLVVSAG